MEPILTQTVASPSVGWGKHLILWAAQNSDYWWMEPNNTTVSAHTPAWVAQVWVSFGLASLGLMAGIFYLDVSSWARAFLGATALLLINSSFALSKTLRDLHEEQRLVRRVDEARVTKLITENDPMTH